MAEIRRNANHWLEPLESFVNAAHQAQSVAGGHDLESLKDFLKRIGSNLRLSGQTLRVSYEERRREAPFADLRMENSWAILARRRKNANWWAVWESNP